MDFEGRFRLGDRVRVQDCPKGCNCDAMQVQRGDSGIIIDIHDDTTGHQPYLVRFEMRGKWWIHEHAIQSYIDIPDMDYLA